MKTALFGYYNKERGAFVTDYNINQQDVNDGDTNNHQYRFNVFNNCFLRFGNIGKETAINTRIEFGSPYDSELYDVLLSYGIPHEYFVGHFNTEKVVKLYADYTVPIKSEPDAYKVQITPELVDLFVYVMNVFMGAFEEYEIEEQKHCFGNNFVNQKQKFTTVKISYEDLNGNHREQEFPIYCRIQRCFGFYNDGFYKMTIELSTSDIIN